jgi:hypothetical protein
MAWDSSRAVPWKRLLRDWLLYVGIMIVVFIIIYRDRLTAGVFTGLFLSGPIFIAVGAVLAKFGYQRKTMRDLREIRVQARQQPSEQATTASSTSRTQQKPPPTKRTGGGTNRPGTKARKR